MPAFDPKNDWCNACDNASVIARELATVAISQFLPTHTPIQAQGPTPLRKLRGLRPFYPPTPFRYASRIYDQCCAGGGEIFVGRLLIPPKNDWCNACGNASVIARELATVAISQFLPTHTPIQAQGPTPLRKLRGLRPFYPPTPFRYASRIYDQRCAGGGCGDALPGSTPDTLRAR